MSGIVALSPGGARRQPSRARWLRLGAAATALAAAACNATMEPRYPSPILASTRADEAPDPAVEPAPAVEPSDFYGRDWVFVAIAGFDGPLPSPPPVAGFNVTVEGRRMTGTTACNRMSSGYEIDFATGRLRFTNLRNTRMLCDRVAADTEEEVLQAMIATDSFRIAGGHLELYGRGQLLARLQPGT